MIISNTKRQPNKYNSPSPSPNTKRHPNNMRSDQLPLLRSSTAFQRRTITPAYGQIAFSRHRLRGYIALRTSWMGSSNPGAPRRQQRRIYNDQWLSEVVTWLDAVLVWFGMQRGMQRGMKTRVSEGLCFCNASQTVYGCAKALRRSRYDCPGGPTSRNGGFSPLKQPWIPPKLAWPTSVTRNTTCPCEQTYISLTVEKRKYTVPSHRETNVPPVQS